MPQLDPTWFASQLFWLVVTFLALYLVLSRFVLPAVLDVLGRRETTRLSDLENAQSFKTQAEEAKQAYEKGLAEARAKAQQLTAEAALAHKAKAEQALKGLDNEMAAKLKEAEKRIEGKKQELISSLTPTAAELTVAIVEKLTQRAPSPEKVQAVIGEIAKGRR